MALQCLWRQMEELLVANGNIRFAASFVFHERLAQSTLLFASSLYKGAASLHDAECQR